MKQFKPLFFSMLSNQHLKRIRFFVKINIKPVYFCEKLKTLLPIVLLTMILSSCAAESESEISNGGSYYPITITDSNGYDVTIQAEPMRIISVSPNMTEIVYALGAGEKLIARSDYCDYPLDVHEIESIGSFDMPDIERILELEPDLVLASAHFRENAAKLEELGTTVLAIYEDEDFEGSFRLTEKVGHALNREAEASVIVEEMKQVINNVSSSVDGLENPSVYYVLWFGDSDSTAGGNTFIGQLIELAGGNNIASNVEGWSYNRESLLEADPDIIVVSNQYNTKELFENSEGYKELSAVKNGHVYEIDNNLLDRQGVRNAEGLKALAEIFHPDTMNKD